MPREWTSDELLRTYTMERAARRSTLGAFQKAAAATIQGAARRRGLHRNKAKQARYDAMITLMRAAGRIISKPVAPQAPTLIASSSDLPPSTTATTSAAPKSTEAAHVLDVLSRLHDGLSELGYGEQLSAPVASALVERLTTIVRDLTDECEQLKSDGRAMERELSKCMRPKEVAALNARLFAERGHLLWPHAL